MTKPKPKKSTRRRPGRPSKYTPELGARIVGAVQQGASWETAAAAAGISRETLRTWLRAGARMIAPRRPSLDGNGKPVLRTLAEFLGAITRAEPHAEVKWLSQVNKGAEADARHAAWLLTHHPRTRDRYADPAQRLIHSGGLTNTNVQLDGGAVDLSALTDDELAALDRLTAKAIGRAQTRSSARGKKPGGREPGQDDLAVLAGLERFESDADDE